MFSKIKTAIIDIHKSLLPAELEGDKRKTRLFYACFYIIFASTFITLIGQLPFFTVRHLTQLFQIGWVIAFVPVLMLDYKRVLRLLWMSIFLIAPFLLYCIIALIFGVNSISYGGTTYIFLCAFLLILFGTFGKYKNANVMKLLFFAYLAGAIIYALVVFFTKLRGYDLDNQIYAFGDKNSAGPIFMSAAILSFYIFEKRSWKFIVIKWMFMAFFIVIIALSKTRSVLIAIPIVIFIFLFLDVENNLISMLALIGFIVALICIFAIPSLRETIIINILFNRKADIDSITSGRITQIIQNMQSFKPIFGTGKSYFDCMPISLLCTYGIIGLITLLPFMVLPFYILFSFRKKCPNRSLKTVLLSIAIVFFAAILLEGFGHIGTGAKVFVLWLLVGCYCYGLSPVILNKKVAVPYKVIDKKIGFIPKKYLIYTIQLVLIIAPIVLIAQSSFVSSTGKAVVDKLPTSNRVANYTEVKDIQIDPPIKSMCVGQDIKFGIKTEPYDAEDTTVYWSTGWIQNPCISVDGYTGVVTANRAANALLHINRFRIGPNGVYIQFPVVEQKDYIFDKTYISLSEFNYSFERSKNEDLVLANHCTSKIFYDYHYVPNEMLIKFESSDSSIAVVENGLIKAISPGKCSIDAVIYGKETTRSVNHINVTVTDKQFIPTTSIDYSLQSNYYQYEPYDIVPSFNDGASDKTFSIKIDGLKYEVEDNKLNFLEYGEATLTITSDNNPDLSISKTINVEKNAPDHFECNTKRMLIGETKNAEELGLYLVYQNGYKKVVDENDLAFDPYDFKNRAWSNQNGLVKGRTVVKAVMPGNIKLSFTSKIDKNVKNDFTIISSVYTQKQYDSLIKGIGVLIVDLILILALIFTLFVNIKRVIILTTTSLISLLYLILIALLYGINVYFVVSLISLVVTLVTLFVVFFSKKKSLPLKFLEDPIDIKIKNESANPQLNYFTIEI